MLYYFHLLNKVFHSSVFLESLVIYQTCDLSYKPEYFPQDSFDYRINSFGHAKNLMYISEKNGHMSTNIWEFPKVRLERNIIFYWYSAYSFAVDTGEKCT